ncbi:MAG: hypothetical protein ACLGHN_07805 [Bacteriovoracia bacterium]
MFVFILLLSGLALAGSESQYAFDKSFGRDNTFCSYKGKKIELMIRGSNRYTEPKERGYGEYIFYRPSTEKKSILLPLNGNRSDTFRLFSGKSSLCSKSHGYQIDSSTLAVLLQKENRPFADKLVIQLFELPSLVPKNSIETDYPSDKAMKTNGGFSFRTIPENYNRDTGKVMIEGEPFIYHEKDFPQWMTYSRDGFSINKKLTYENSPWKKAFKDEKDFYSTAAWDPKEKKFSKLTIYVAINHKLKKQCLLFIEMKQKPAGNETWRCHGL